MSPRRVFLCLSMRSAGPGGEVPKEDLSAECARVRCGTRGGGVLRVRVLAYLRCAGPLGFWLDYRWRRVRDGVSPPQGLVAKRACGNRAGKVESSSIGGNSKGSETSSGTSGHGTWGRSFPALPSCTVASAHGNPGHGRHLGLFLTVFSISTALVFVFIWKWNQRAAGKLQHQIDELDALRQPGSRAV